MGYYINYMNSNRTNFKSKRSKPAERSVFRFNHININHVTRNGNNKPLWNRLLHSCICSTPVNDNANIYRTDTENTAQNDELSDNSSRQATNRVSTTSWTLVGSTTIHNELMQSRALYKILHNNDILRCIIQYLDWADILLFQCVNKYVYTYCHMNNATLYKHIHTLSLTYQYGNLTQLQHYTPVPIHHRAGRAAILLAAYHKCCPSTITTIDLSMSDYSSWDTDILLRYKHVTSLSLSGNPITDFVLFHLCSVNYMKQITSLDLMHTRITQIAMPILSELTQLQSLKLSAQVNLNSECTKYIGRLINLQQLTLSGMALTDKDMLCLQNCTQLQSLSLIGLQAQRIPFTGSCFELLAPKCTNLQQLTIINSEILDSGISYICDNCMNLTELSLSASYRITDISCNILANSIITPRLKSLDLSYCAGLSEIGLGYLPHLTQLTTLSIRNCCFSNVSIVELFYNLTLMNVQLTELDVSGWHQLISPDHRIDSMAIAELVDALLLPELQLLRILGCNRISDQCIVNDIARHKKLKQIHIDENTLKRAQYVQIQQYRKQQQLPSLTIISTPV